MSTRYTNIAGTPRATQKDDIPSHRLAPGPLGPSRKRGRTSKIGERVAAGVHITRRGAGSRPSCRARPVACSRFLAAPAPAPAFGRPPAGPGLPRSRRVVVQESGPGWSPWSGITTRRMYFWIVRLATRMPRLSSSPRIRSAPQSRLLRAMRSINAIVSPEVRGRRRPRFVTSSARGCQNLKPSRNRRRIAFAPPIHGSPCAKSK